MAGSKQQFTLQFNADTTQARKALQDLNNSLNAMMKLQHFDSGLHQDITEAADAARVLQQELQKATNVNTGKLNISDFVSGLSQAGTSLTELSGKLLNAGQTGQMAFNNLAQSIVAAEVPMKKMNATLSNALTTLKNTIKWEVSSTFVHGLESAFSGAVSYAKNLNTSLTDIRIVTGQSVDDMARFAVQANKAAKELSTTTKAYADASLIYYQQGDSAEAAAKKAAITIKAANASFGTSAAEMSEYLTSVWNSYKVGADELERYVDIMAALGAKTATSLEEIATSMQKVAATANTVGVSMEQVSSIISTVSSVTRESAESIGTSYKTIFARIGDLKLGGTTEDGIGLGQVSSQLESIGVKILNTQGNLRDMGDIITDLGNKWQTMSEAQKTATAQVVAGKRQYTQLMALFENWDMYNQNLNIAENADGELQQMADIYAESWEAASARVQASLEGIYGKLINDQALIKMTNLLADFIGGIENVVEGLGGLPGLLATLGNVATTVFRGKMAAGFNDMAKSITNWGKSFQGKGFFGGIGSILKGESAAVREYQRLLNELKGEAMGQAGAYTAGTTENMKWENTQKVIEAKQRLVEIERNLSEAERAAAQHSINDAVSALNNLESVTAAYEEQNTSVQKLTKSISSLDAQRKGYENASGGKERSLADTKNRNKQAISKQWKKDDAVEIVNGELTTTTSLHKAFNAIGNTTLFDQTKLLGAGASVEQLVKRFSDLKQAAAALGPAGAGLEDVFNHLKEGKLIANDMTRVSQILDDLKVSLKGTDISTNFIDDLKQDLQKLYNSGDVEGFRNSLVSAFRELNQSADVAGSSADAALRFLVRSLNLSEEELMELGEQAGLSAQKLKELAAVARGADEALDDINVDGGNFGEAMANIINGCTAALASFESMSSTMENWDTSNLTSKISSIGNTVLSVAGQFATGNWVGGIMSAVGAGIGYLVGSMEQELKKAQERIDKMQEEWQDKIEKNAEALEKEQSLIANFNTLYAAYDKTEGVSDQLRDATLALANAYNIEGAAIATLTGDFDQLLIRLRKIRTGDYSSSMFSMDEALADLQDYQAALSTGDFSRWQNESIGWTAGLVGALPSDDNTYSSKISEKDVHSDDMQAAIDLGYGGAGFKDAGYGDYVETYVAYDKHQSKWSHPTMQTRIKNANGKDSGYSVGDVIDEVGAGDLFFEHYNTKGVNWLISENDSFSYKQLTYEKAQEIMDLYTKWGLSVDDWLYKQAYDYVSTMRPQMEVYEELLTNAKDSLVNQTSRAFIGFTPDSLGAQGFIDTYNAYYETVFEVLKQIYPDQDEATLKNLTEDLLGNAINLNSSLTDYGVAMQAALDYYGDIDQATAVLTDLVSSGADLTEVDTKLFLAYDSGNKELVQKALDTKRKQAAATEDQNRYNQMLNAKSLIKEDMSLDDAKVLRGALDWGKNGIISWSEFYGKTYEEQQAYLEQMADDYLETMRESQQAAYDAADAERQAWQDTYDQYQVEATNAKGEKVTYTGAQIETLVTEQIEFELEMTTAAEGLERDENGRIINNEANQAYIAAQTDANIQKYLSALIGAESAEDEPAVYDRYAKGIITTDDGITFNAYDIQGFVDAGYALAAAKGVATEEMTELEAIMYLINSSASEAAMGLSELVGAINELPTDEKQLRQMADLLGWDMDTLAHSTAAERAAAVAAMEKPELKKSGIETYTDWTEVDPRRPVRLLVDEQINIDSRGRMWVGRETTRAVSTDQDYADYIEDTQAWQEANPLNAQYIEQGIRDGAIETLATIEELSSILSSINISDLPEQGAKAYEQLQKALAKVNISMADFMKMNDSSKYAAIAKAQNKLIDEEIAVNKQLQDHYASIMNDTSGRYDEATRMEATQNYYDAVTEGNNLVLQQEQNIANARAQAAEVYAQQAEMAKARAEEAKKEAEELKTVAETMANVIETGELSNTDKNILSQAGYLDDWNNAATAAERAALASKVWSEYAAETARAGEELSASYNKTSQALNGISKGYKAWKDDQSDIKGKDGEMLDLQNKDDYLQYLQDYTDMTEEQLGHISQAWANLEAQGIDLSTKTNAEITELLAQQLIDMGVDVDQAWQEAAANAKDAIKDIGASMAQDHIEAAQTAADAWLNAFQQIAEARKILLSGGSLLEQIAGDPAKILQYSKSSGLTPQQVTDQIISGALTVDQLNYSSPTDYIDTQMAQYGLDLTSQYGSKIGDNRYADIQALGYKDSRKGWVDSEGNLVSVDLINGQLKEYYSAILQATGLTKDQADQQAQEIIDGKRSYSELTSARDGLTEAIHASAMAQEMWTRQQEAETAVQAVELEEQRATVNGKSATQSELTDLQGAIERAQAAKYANQSWDSLSSADQELLSSFGISFDNVDSAAESCANALLACAEAALTLAKQAANDQGYYENAEGNYEQAMTEDEYVAAYGSTFEGGEEAARAHYQGLASAEGAEFTTNATGEQLLFIGNESEAITSSIQGAEDAVNSFRTSAEEVPENTMQRMAESVGMTRDEFEQFTQAMIDAGEITAETTEGQYEQARSLARIQKGLKTARDSMTDWKKSLKETQGDAIAHNKVLGEMRSSFEEMLDMSIGSLNDLPEAFMTSAETADLLKGAMEGDIDSYNKLQAAVAEQILIGEGATVSPDVQNAIATISTEMDKLPVNEPIEFGKGAGISDDLYNALNTYIASVAQAGGDVEAAAAALGFSLEFEKKTLPVNMPGVDYVAGATVTDPATGITYRDIQPREVDGQMIWEGFAVKAITNKGSHGGNIGGSNPQSSGGGGGGGGSKPKKLDKKKPEDHKERYHETNQSLERLADELEKVDKLKSRAYGKGHLDAIKQEIGLLKQEIGLQQDYIKQAQAYLKIDKNRVASLGATFNADGTISNYDELIDSIVAKYNAFIEKYNAASASAQEDMEEEKEEMDEWFDEAMEWISQYEDTLNIIRDKENEILELQNEISAKTLEGIQYKVEFEVELNEEEVDFLDYLNKKYSEVLEKQDEMVENLVKQQQLAQENLGYLNNAKAELDAKFASGELNQADYVTGLQDINDQILENLSTLEELRKEIQEAYGNALEMASEAIDNHTEKMEHASQAMQSYISIMGLIGKGVDYDKLSDYYDKQYTYNLKSLETQQQYLEVLKEEESYYLAKMAAGDLTETERIQFEALQDTIAEVEDGILAKTEETLSALREAFSIAVEGILRDFEESVAGSGNTLEDLAADYEYYLEVQERHVSTSKELYEISKLNRQIEQDIADTSSSVYKQRLAALQEEIKAKSADRALTEYDIQMMNLEYELLQRQMALEEAKNAKDTVRLTRDSSGNYVYQYTADQDAISEAQQGVEDVLQQMAEANAERVTQLEQETINTYQNMVSQIEEIANSEVLTQEEKNAKIAEIVAQAQEKMLWLQDQYGIATENTMATNALIQDHYNTDMITNAQISSEAMNETIAAIINKSTELSDGMATMQEQIGQEMAELEYDINTVLNTTAWDDAGEKISTYDQVVDDATTEVDEMIDTLSGEDGLLDSIKDTTAAWDAQAAAIDALIKYYEDLYVSITKAQNAQANVTNPSTGGSVTDPGTDTETPKEEEETPEESNKVQYQGGTWKFYTYGQESGGKKGAIFYGNGKAPVVTKEDEGDNRIKISGEDGKGNTFSSRWIAKVYRGKELWKAYAMGGLVDYTGPAWVDGTKSQPELMLNATDTQNMLAAVQTVRALDSATLNMLDEFIKLATSSMLSADNLHASGVASTDTELQQQVQITAEFPNVQDSNEIQDAFDNLINRAAQYIGSKK